MYLTSKNIHACLIHRQIAIGLPNACNSPRSAMSSLHKNKPLHQQHRRPPHTTTLSPPPAATVPSSTSPTSFSDEDTDGNNDNIFDQEDDDLILEKFAGMRKSSGGYTPFEFIEFSNIVLKHEVSIRVKAPPSHCYQVWHNRCNWMEWFDLIDEMGFHEEDRNLVSMYLWYRWALTPFLELYLTLGRTKDEENKYIVEEPVEGMPLVAAVLFQEEDRGSSDSTGTGTSSTVVTLRVGYQLPKVLYEFAGKLAVYADVDEKLRVAMKKMKGFAEGVDPAIVANMAQEAEAQITQGFIEQRGNDARREEQTRLKESEKTQAAAAAAAARAALAEADPIALEEKKQSQQQGGVSGVTALGMSSIDHEEEEEEEEENDTDVEGEEGDDNDGEHSAAAIIDDEGKRLGRPKGTLNKHPKFPTSKDLTELRKRT